MYRRSYCFKHAYTPIKISKSKQQYFAKYNDTVLVLLWANECHSSFATASSLATQIWKRPLEYGVTIKKARLLFRNPAIFVWSCTAWLVRFATFAQYICPNLLYSFNFLSNSSSPLSLFKFDNGLISSQSTRVMNAPLREHFQELKQFFCAGPQSLKGVWYMLLSMQVMDLLFASPLLCLGSVWQ